jgi:hypothetical protein
VLPEAFPDQAFQPVSLNRPPVNFAGNSHAQARTALAIGFGQDLEAGIRRNAGFLKKFAKGPLIGQAMLLWETHSGKAAQLGRAIQTKPKLQHVYNAASRIQD